MNPKRWFTLLLLFGICAITVYGISIAANDKEADEQGEAVSLEDIPDAVKATILAEILREVDGLKLEEIEREMKDGNTVYEAEFEYEGKDIELKIAANGKLLDRQVERDDDDDGEDDDDDE